MSCEEILNYLLNIKLIIKIKRVLILLQLLLWWLQFHCSTISQAKLHNWRPSSEDAPYSGNKEPCSHTPESSRQPLRSGDIWLQDVADRVTRRI
jgi:hypothetical protein